MTAFDPEQPFATAVSFPVAKRVAYMKFKNQASHFAIVDVFVAETPAACALG